MKQEKQVMTKYEYCCVLGGSDDMSKVTTRANDGWRVVSVEGHQGYAFFYMEREVRTEPLYLNIKGAGSCAALKPGDVVRLKSGGPEMTVDSVGSVCANCVWHVDRQAHRAAYALTSLAVVK